jgi:hypothetical protein
LLIGIANAGMGMRLHSAAPTTILIARAFMGHLLLVLFPKQARQPRTGVLDGRDFLDWPDLRFNFNAQKATWFLPMSGAGLGAASSC